jgi:2-keto-4-pentenoate hydratase
LADVSQFDEAPYVRREMCPLNAVHLNPTDLPADLAAAYSLIREVTAKDPGFGAAWKLGGTTEATQKVFNVDKLYFGILHQSELAIRPRVAPGFPTFELKGEAEIALRLAPAADIMLNDGPDAVRKAPTDLLFDGWCLALELPSSPITNLVDRGVVALIADRCAAGFLALGDVRDMQDKSGWPNTEIRIDQNGQPLACGSAAKLLSPPHECTHAFLAEALEQGYRPRAGQWVTTGGATPCVPFDAGARIEVYYGQSLELSFTAGF